MPTLHDLETVRLTNIPLPTRRKGRLNGKSDLQKLLEAVRLNPELRELDSLISRKLVARSAAPELSHHLSAHLERGASAQSRSLPTTLISTAAEEARLGCFRKKLVIPALVKAFRSFDLTAHRKQNGLGCGDLPESFDRFGTEVILEMRLTLEEPVWPNYRFALDFLHVLIVFCRRFEDPSSDLRSAFSMVYRLARTCDGVDITHDRNTAVEILTRGHELLSVNQPQHEQWRTALAWMIEADYRLGTGHPKQAGVCLHYAYSTLQGAPGLDVRCTAVLLALTVKVLKMLNTPDAAHRVALVRRKVLARLKPEPDFRIL